MNNRKELHYYEEALIKAIAAKDEAESLKLIKLIQKSSNASLLVTNQSNQNFLLLAIKNRMSKVATVLLDKLKNSAHVIFKFDDDNNSVVWYAAKNGYSKILKELIVIAEMEKKIEHKPWLSANLESVTPLQIAAQQKRERALNVLLKVIKKESNAYELINRGDSKAETALHKALSSRAIECIVLLIDYGADLYVHNSAKKRPIDLFFSLTNQQQQEIFNQIQDKNILLAAYKSELIANPENHALKTFYFRLCGIQSLQGLLLAHHDFGNAPLRSTYDKTERVGKNKNEHGNYPVETQEVFVESSILNRMPIFRARLEQAILELEPTQDKPVKLINDDWQTISIVESNDKIHLLDQDRINLITLIEDIDAFLNDLQNRRTFFYSDKALAVLLPIVVWAALVGLMVGLYYVGEANQESHNYYNYEDKHWPMWYVGVYTISACIAFIGGAAATIGSCVFFCDREARISKRDWQNILKDLEINVTDKLEILEKKSDANRSLLPINSANLNNLVAIKTELNSNQYLSAATNMFNNLKNILTTLLEEMNKTNKPLSLFSERQTVIDIPTYQNEEFDEILDETLEEELPLLRYKGNY